MVCLVCKVYLVWVFCFLIVWFVGLPPPPNPRSSEELTPYRNLAFLCFVCFGTAQTAGQASKLNWNVLSGRMYTVAPTGKSREQLYALLFNKAARDSQKNPYEEKAYRGPAHKEVQAWSEQCQKWMLYHKGQCAPLVQDIRGFLHALRGKEVDARAEVDAYMEYCAKRWQARRALTSSSDDDSCRM